MNTTIQNPVAAVAAMNRPVSVKDIANVLQFPVGTVGRYLSSSHTAKPGSKAELVKETAAKMGYLNRNQRKQQKAENRYYRNMPFHSMQEAQDYMRHLRDGGFGNTEIAQRAGVTVVTVRRYIGPTPADLAKHNRMMGQKIRAQKNAARKAYVRNKPILEYNARVEEHNKLKAQVARMEAELKPQMPAIEKAAQIQIAFPMIDLKTVQPTALQ